MKEYLTLFWTFCRIGGLTFGGGYAMLPMLEKEVVERHHWTTQEELLDYFAIGQCTPGIIAVNTATFIGHKLKGVLGAIVATFGVIFPSFVIISLISAVLDNFAHIIWVQQAFNGIRVAVCALILQAVIKLMKSSIKSIKNVMAVLLFAIAFLLILILDISPVIVVICAALIGILAGKLRAK